MYFAYSFDVMRLTFYRPIKKMYQIQFFLKFLFLNICKQYCNLNFCMQYIMIQLMESKKLVFQINICELNKHMFRVFIYLFIQRQIGIFNNNNIFWKKIFFSPFFAYFIGLSIHLFIQFQKRMSIFHKLKGIECLL